MSDEKGEKMDVAKRVFRPAREDAAAAAHATLPVAALAACSHTWGCDPLYARAVVAAMLDCSTVTWAAGDRGVCFGRATSTSAPAPTRSHCWAHHASSLYLVFLVFAPLVLLKPL